MNTRQCPFTGCKAMIDPERFACFRHWQLLRACERARIYDVYAAWKNGSLDGDALRLAQADVVLTVEARQIQPETPPAGPAYPGTTPGVCSACKAAILWATTVNGKQMPLDAEPTQAGNVSVTPAGAQLLPKDTLAKARAANARLFMPHHASCPEAARFKRRK